MSEWQKLGGGAAPHRRDEKPNEKLWRELRESADLANEMERQWWDDMLELSMVLMRRTKGNKR